MERVALYTYHYDPLDRLTGTKSARQSDSLRFYCQNRITTEIQGTAHHSIMQQGNQILAQLTHEPHQQKATLCVTDSQRSILHTLDTQEQYASAYTAYGHHPKQSGFKRLSGYNGERADAVTGHYLLGNGYRAFNPILMRFNSPDSMSPFDKGGINSYAYCLNNPVNLRDDNGHFPFTFLSTVTERFNRLLDTYLPLNITSLDQPLSRGHTFHDFEEPGRMTGRRRYDSNNKEVYSKILDYNPQTRIATIHETGKPSRFMLASETIEPLSLQQQAYSKTLGPLLNHPETLRHVKNIKDLSSLNQMNYLKARASFDHLLTSSGVNGSLRARHLRGFNAQVSSGNIRGVLANSERANLTYR